MLTDRSQRWRDRRSLFVAGDSVIDPRRYAVDVVAHELTHGVIEREAGLVYADQSGALNESLADVFGAMVKQHHFE